MRTINVHIEKNKEDTTAEARAAIPKEQRERRKEIRDWFALCFSAVALLFSITVGLVSTRSSIQAEKRAEEAASQVRESQAAQVAVLPEVVFHGSDITASIRIHNYGKSPAYHVTNELQCRANPPIFPFEIKPFLQSSFMLMPDSEALSICQFTQKTAQLWEV